MSIKCGWHYVGIWIDSVMKNFALIICTILFSFCIFPYDYVTITSLLPVDISIHQSLSQIQVVWENQVCQLTCENIVSMTFANQLRKPLLSVVTLHLSVKDKHANWNMVQKVHVQLSFIGDRENTIHRSRRKIDTTNREYQCIIVCKKKAIHKRGKKLLLKPSIILKFERTL